MKGLGLALAIVGSIFLLAGCGGGNGADGGDGDILCATQADCDDGRFCTGTERCVNGVCRAGEPPCSDGNPCTEDICVEFVQTCRAACAATGLTDPCCDDPECLDSDNCPFSGGTFLFQVTALSQQPANCVISQGFLDLLLPLLTGANYPVIFPPEASYPTSIDLNLPFLNAVAVPATFDNAGREIDLGPVLSQGIDLGGFNIANWNCLVGGTAEGRTSGLSQLTVPLNVSVTQMSVGMGSGEGNCLLLLTPPAPNCSLSVSLEGNKVSP